MIAEIGHRGPDTRGIWLHREAGLALAHARLSIIDLSDAGAQPMTSADRRWTIVFNGEIYNFKEMRAVLAAAGRSFRGRSDTEVLLEACAAYGPVEVAARCNGMFAFAVFDAERRELWLARDHVGIKPLYWTLRDGALVFGSELKAIRAADMQDLELDRSAVASFFRLGYVPTPQTIYLGIEKLPPGSCLRVSANGRTECIPFWSFADAASSALKQERLSDADAVDALEELLADAVKRQMVADVPTGVLLSGGVDSSVVAALAQAASPRPVQSFSIGFNEPEFDESTHAEGVARHLGTDHATLVVDPATARDVIPQLPQMYDEPFADSSQIPTYLVSALTRRHVTVVLSGDGGDELFAGYSRYFHALRIARLLGYMPEMLKSFGSRLLRHIPAGSLDRFAARFLPAQGKRLGTRLRRLGGLLDRPAPDDVYLSLMSLWARDENPANDARAQTTVLDDGSANRLSADFLDRMRYCDSVTYLPDDILTKLDRASMAVSLEARVPLLDTRIAEFAWRLSPNQLVRHGVGKWALRQVLYRHVPQALVDRPKMGFGVPLGTWMRGPLRDWCEVLLEPKALAEGGVLDPAPIRRKWEEHIACKADWQYPIWTALMFQAWRKKWL